MKQPIVANNNQFSRHQNYFQPQQPAFPRALPLYTTNGNNTPIAMNQMYFNSTQNNHMQMEQEVRHQQQLPIHLLQQPIPIDLVGFLKFIFDTDY